MVLTQNLIYEILSVVEEIPAGRVVSYGQIARLIGLPACSRLWGACSRKQSSTATTRATAS